MGRRFGPKKEHAWVTDITSSNLSSETNTAFAIIIGSDWERSASKQAVTVHRVVGNLWWLMSDTVAAAGTSVITFALGKADEDATSVNPKVEAFYDDEDCMWSYQSAVRKNSVNETDNQVYGRHVPIDVRVKRKIFNGQDIEMSIGSELVDGTYATLRYGWLLRTLIQFP